MENTHTTPFALKLFAWYSHKMDVLYEHFLRQYLTYILLMMAYLLFGMHFEFAINVSNSLPGTLYLIRKGELPTKGQYIAFTYQNDFIYPKGAHLLKRVAGVSGDMITSATHKYYVNGKYVGEARTVTSQGLPIQESELNGVIPAGYYYAQADHPRSFDSRYAAIGLVSSSYVLGRAYKVF
jgi:conjugal transfer pilin signal peptidase TrbI